MTKSKTLFLALAAAAALATVTTTAMADDNSTNAVAGASTAKPASSATNAAPAKAGGAGVGGQSARPPRKLQADDASTNAVFGAIARTDAAYKSALDAHALADALKMVDQDGAFKGTVAKVFEPRGLAIVEFDENYKTALTAIVRGTNFSKFPVLTNLIGKDVLVTGKFIKFRESAEIVLEKPEQIKVVASPK